MKCSVRQHNTRFYNAAASSSSQYVLIPLSALRLLAIHDAMVGAVHKIIAATTLLHHMARRSVQRQLGRPDELAHEES